MLLKSFVDLAGPPPGKKGSKLAAAIPAASFILESFGNATTLHNSNGSKFARYSELQFSDKGRLVGLKGLEYYLEKSRVTRASAGERNFHVFNYLLAGGQHIRLDDATSFRYLSHHRGSAASSSSDALRFGQLEEAFKTVGFSKKTVASIFQLLSAILHLGNLDFHFDRSRNADSALVKNLATLEIVAELFGVESSALEVALTNKMMLVGGEMCDVFLDPEAAAANRDDLARILYSLIFSFVGELLNEKLCRDDFSTFIAIVDFPGPVQTNSSQRDGFGIDAFCFNLASERARAFNLGQLFEANKLEYVTEGLGSSLAGLDVEYNSNAEIIRVLTNTPGGLVHIIDDQSRRKGKTDASMVKAMSKRWGNHSSFTSREGDEALGRPGTFHCSHWDGQVDYSSEGFLAHNSSALSPTFVTLLAGTTPAIGVDGRTTPGSRDQLSVDGSSSSFVRQLFASVEITAHPQSKDAIVGANQKVAPRRAPSTRRPQGRNAIAAVDAEEDDTEANKPDPGRSVVKEFDDSLTTLFSTLATTKTWHILCLSPNSAQLPNQIDAKLLRHQIRSLGIAELAKRLQGEWLANLELKEWWERYQGLPQLMEHSAMLAPLPYREKVIKAREILNWTEKDLAVGKSKVRLESIFYLHRADDTARQVFLSDAAFRGLEDPLRADDVEEQQRNNEKSQRRIADDPYSPYPFPEAAPLANYNHTFAQTTSTAALPLFNRQGGGVYEELEYENDNKTIYTEGESEYLHGGGGYSAYDDDRSMRPSEAYAPSRKAEKDTMRDYDQAQPVMKDAKPSAGRRRWVALTWIFTWWIPSYFLDKCGGMKRGDIRMAWREKVLIK